MARDYYEVLGVSKGASDKDVRAAYRRMARRYHPDVNPGDARAEGRFKEVNEAYEVLSDLEKRRLYDRFGANWKYAQQAGGAPPGTGAEGPFVWRTEEGPGGFDDLIGEAEIGDLFDRFFGGRGGSGRTATRTRRAPPVAEQQVEVSLEEAYIGTTRLLQMPRVGPCPACAGAGRSGATPCPACLGRGVVARPARLEVAIPPGVDTGSKVRITPGEQEVVLHISVQPHARFQRRGSDLYTEAPVALYDAMLGGEVIVPTLKGQVALNMPPETQNGRVFRLAGQGMPHLGNPAVKGDLYVTVKVSLPTGLTQQERELLRRLKGMRNERR
ncbi:MAG: DnaJ domain-containing protein [Chloroflexi bacterium]|nr:DnaJ domain-containing protein [Chloroflexota bacterium]